MIVLGIGGIEPCVSSFGADQFDENDETEKLKKISFFNWFYFSANVGAFVAAIVISWIQMNIGWGCGFGVLTVAMVIAVMFFFSGSRYYRLQRPQGNPLTRIFQVIVAALRKISVEFPEDKSQLFEIAADASNITGSNISVEQVRFFDKAAVESQSDSINDGEVNPWRLCSLDQTAVFFVALYMIALGIGGIEPCVSSFGADQFDENDETEKLKKISFFNWFYFSANVGAFVAAIVISWIQMNIGWGWGFGVPTVAMVIAVMFFFSGSRYYRLQRPQGNPLTRIFQVIVAALRKISVEVPEDKSQLFEIADDASNITGSWKLEHTDNLK
ncbi:hypothetical protein F2Q68_00041496 [Brassica cretica]|uniref:Major facilitator superfamily (MFS) profile domain-containing protein n=1 Tax=Brassica cretica TaxID=69181 RepID=A0A8S9MNH9_BRACR|nr:hypothetical protein F2Q68_00041496 [Brassica cretica]